MIAAIALAALSALALGLAVWRAILDARVDREWRNFDDRELW